MDEVVDKIPYNKKNDHAVNIHDLKPLIKCVFFILIVFLKGGYSLIKSDGYPDIDEKFDISHQNS